MSLGERSEEVAATSYLRSTSCSASGSACRSIACQSCGITYNTTMEPPKIVMDTNVLVAGLRSRRGASFRLLQLLGTGRFEIAISVALVLEYEDVLMRDVAA